MGVALGGELGVAGGWRGRCGLWMESWMWLVDGELGVFVGGKLGVARGWRVGVVCG